PAPRIVAGGNHDAASGAQIFYGVGERRCRRIVVGQLDWDSGARDDLRRRLSKPAGAETGVVAYDDSATRIFIFQDVRSNGASHAAHVLEGEIVGDNAAPTVGSKFNFVHHPLSFSVQLPSHTDNLVTG